MKVGKDGRNIKDGEKYIYLNKETGEPISGNGKKYKVNTLNGELIKNSNGYILENNEEINNILPKRMASLSIIPQQSPPPGMMKATQSLPPGGFIGNRLPISHVFVPKGSNNLSYSGSMFTSGPAPPSKLVPTVNAKNVLQKKTFKPGFRS